MNHQFRTDTRRARVVDLPAYRLEVHLQGCDCAVCQPRLDAPALAKLTLGAIATAHVIAAVLWGPATVLQVLVANLTGSAL